MNKKCSQCGLEKDFLSFCKEKRSPDGLCASCKSCHNKINKLYQKSDLGKETLKLYRKTNNSKRYHREYKRKRREDPEYKIAELLRVRTWIAVSGRERIGSAIRDLGCTVSELKTHLEKQFKPGMTWKNHSVHGWHVDHIKSLSLFDLTDRNQFLQACHYTNLQPMWARENLIKHNKII